MVATSSWWSTASEREIATRVGRVGIGVTAGALSAGAVAAAADGHVGLLAVAFVLGWTRLVGL